MDEGQGDSGRVGEGEVDGRQAETGGGGEVAERGGEVAAGRRVLVIEDDAHIKDLLTDVLTGDGFAVTGADSVLGAAALVRRLRPCAIVLDLGLPYRSGASLLTDLKADPETAGIPVIVVSALPETLTPERRALATAVLAKPISIRDLLRAVHAVCPDVAQSPGSPFN
ncbi:MAG TPA: response regulator [Chloroflexota bacterium]|nr:response regulator [Chloroflexota bacterium]